eukprot:CCRYP_017470-RA/>CCRYP_017470-RA protein AED:0.30 eAED:0.30 QI:0/0/0/1/0/0/3/0/473
MKAADAIASRNDFTLLNPEDLLKLVWAYATAKVSHPVLLAMWAYATLQEFHLNLFKSMGENFFELDDLTPFSYQDVVHLLWAYSLASTQNPVWFALVGKAIVANEHYIILFEEIVSFNCCSCICLRKCDSPFFHWVENVTTSSDDFKILTVRALSSIAWAYASVNMTHPSLLDKVGTCIVARDDLSSFTPWMLSEMICSYATLDKSNLGLFKTVGDTIVAMNDMSTFTLFDLSSILWAYATAKVAHNCLYKKVEEAVLSRDDISVLTPRGFSKIAWAYITAATMHSSLFRKIGHECPHLFYDTGDAIAESNDYPNPNPNIMWAFATANVMHHGLFERVSQAVAVYDIMKMDNPQALLRLALAYALRFEGNQRKTTVRCLLRRIGDVIVARADNDLISNTSEDLSKAFWAYTRTNVQHPGLFRKIGDVLFNSEDLSGLTHRDVFSIVWAFDTACESQPDLLKKIAEVIARLGGL